MWSRRIDPTVLRDVSWWHWVLTILLLAAHLVGMPGALAAATVLCLVMSSWYFFQLRAVKPYPVQIRLAFAVLLLAGLLPGMAWLHWVQFAGTSAMVTWGYCPLARILLLAPWNRTQPLSWSLASDVVFYQPTVGGILVAQGIESGTASCSLANRKRGVFLR